MTAVRGAARPEAVVAAGIIALGSAVACDKDPSDTGGDLRSPPTVAAVLSEGNPGKDEDPSVLRARDGIQDEQGAFHLAWFRWDAPFRGHVWYNRFVERKAPGAAGWTAAMPAAGLNSASEHDHLPFAARVGQEIALAWVRHDDSQALPWLNAKSDVWLARSADGLSWSSPVRVTKAAGSVVNLFPGLFLDEDGATFVNWLSTRQAEPRPFQLPLAQAGRYPEGVSRIEGPGSGYSHRLTPTITPGVWIAVWVSGSEGSQDVHYRFFERG